MPARALLLLVDGIATIVMVENNIIVAAIVTFALATMPARMVATAGLRRAAAFVVRIDCSIV